MPHGDPQDPETMVAGVRKRFAFAPPSPDELKMERLGRFVDQWLATNMTPLPPDSDTSVQTWLSKCLYPTSRKQELLRVHEEIPSIWDDPKYLKCKGFMKDEFYPEFKHVRGINSRHDRFKTAVGPIFKLIEDQLYQHPAFIKHVPVADRPRVIRDALYTIGAKYVATDYTAFESLFTRLVMETVEFRLYKYMTQWLPEHNEFKKILDEVIGGRNVIDYKNFRVEIDATRMSGEMCTSLGNGFSNLMFMLFVCSELGSEALGFVEGDDGIFRVTGPLPSSADFEKLGLVIKLEVHEDLSAASFCGIIFDPEECINITDPRKVLASFGFTTRQYARASGRLKRTLLRCKALSYAHQYPGCPIIGSLAKYGLRMTRGYDVAHFARERWSTGIWEREKLLNLLGTDIPEVPVGFRTRLLVEKLYGITVDVQIAIEIYLDNLNELRPLDIPCSDLIMPQVWFQFYESYSNEVCDERPSREWPIRN
jgi:hypothetical protein